MTRIYSNTFQRTKIRKPAD